MYFAGNKATYTYMKQTTNDVYQNEADDIMRLKSLSLLIKA